MKPYYFLGEGEFGPQRERQFVSDVEHPQEGDKIPEASGHSGYIRVRPEVLELWRHTEERLVQHW